jgi:hypothetical protein
MQRDGIAEIITAARGRKLAIAHAVLLPLFWAPGLALAQVSETLNGPPVQVTPYLPEPGVPAITIPQGSPTPITSGTGDGSSTSGGDTSGNDPMDTMLAQSWGSTAIADAQALGLNPSALAATCVIESGCGANVGDGSGAQGVFQMYPDAYQDGLQTALAADPSLASEIVQGTAGMDDPTTEAIAASGYLIQANQALENDGISDPTVLDARAYYNFGPTNGVALATADNTNELVSEVIPNVPQTILSENGISPGETVAQWQASVSSKIGRAADQSVL